MTRSNLFLGMITPFYESLDQPDTDTYITVSSYMVPAGALFVVVVCRPPSPRDTTVLMLAASG